MTDELRALADRWAEVLINRRGLTLLDVERFAPVLVAGEAGSKRKGEGKR